MNLKDGGSGEPTNPPSKRHSGFRGGSTGRGGKRPGRGKGNSVNPTSLAEGQKEATIPVRIRPTHFLALPLNNHPSLIAQINTFQKGLFSDVDRLNDNFAASESTSTPAEGKRSKVATLRSSLVEGLDSSIVIDPQRLHMTLGVMALEQDDDTVEIPIAKPETIMEEPPLTQPQPLSLTAPPPPPPPGHSSKKTVLTALSQLNSLKPRISEILDCDKGVKIPLETMYVLKTEKMKINMKKRRRGNEDKEVVSKGDRNEDGGRDDSKLAHNDDMDKKKVGANVLYVAPEIKNESVNTDLRKLIQVSNLVHQTFKDAGYLTDTRPLKLHCTILNTSHRKNRPRRPFSYSDILSSDALRFLCGNAGDSNSQSVATEASSLADPEAQLVETATIQEGKPSGSIPDDLSTSLPQPNTSSSSNPDLRSKVSSNISIKSKGHSVMNNPTYVSVNLGVFPVEEIQLWVLGSHGPNNEYVSCGGMLLE